MANKKRIILGISGASGAIYGIRTLEILSELGIETHLVISKTARQVLRAETDMLAESLEEMASQSYHPDDLSASIASGSYQTDGMLIVPCSIKTLSGVANSYADNLMVRAADVCLKEGRPLLLAVREAPLHAGHLHLMQLASQAGAIIFPPIPSFYGSPQSIAELVDQTIGRMLLRMGIENTHYKEWEKV
ncbi:MAG: UbiX family flavin prenyltransferase [Anaerolineaceae bacterium]|nr:UbiX family flavin prenyltransferase [Anaerolineaceae bacterium]